MHRFVLTTTAAFLLTAGPLPAQVAAQPGGSSELPSVVLPPESDRVPRDYERAWGAHDAKALAALFAEDGFVLQSNRARAWARRAPGQPWRIVSDMDSLNAKPRKTDAADAPPASA